MGCSLREKDMRTNRRPRPLKSDPRNGSIDKSGFNLQLGFNDASEIPNPNFEGSGSWGYCTEEQLEEVLLTNLEFIYNEAIVKLVALGYDENVALNAILRNGHWYGGMDVLTNVLHNSLSFLTSRNEGDGDNDNKQMIFHLKQLEEYSLDGMVYLLQQIRPHLSKGDAMLCLLMNDLHVGRASMMEVANGNSDSNSESNGSVADNVETLSHDSVGVTPDLFTFHGGSRFRSDGIGMSKFPLNRFLSYAAPEMSLEKEIECPKRFNLNPSMKTLIKQNVAMFAAGYKANTKRTSNGNSSNAAVVKVDEVQSVKNQEVVDTMLSKFRVMKLEGDTEYVSEDKKDEMIRSLLNQIKDLEKQVTERKDWGHQKAMQAARKLSRDLSELKTLRMESEEIQQLKQVKSSVEDATMKRISEMETGLRNASGQVDLTNADVRRLETENAEIRAEMEASKLSASETVNTCLEVAKREKKYLKRRLAWEKQKLKLQDDILAEKRMIGELLVEIVQVEAAKKLAEAELREGQKGKELALAQVEEERRLKEATEANNKRTQEALRSKIELDYQRHKDDLQRLEQELSRRKTSTNNLHTSEVLNGSHQTITSLLHELYDHFEETEGGVDRECIFCLKDEVSVVFLPCAHQVLCATCNDEYGTATKGNATCPVCRAVIEQRIRVFGASA